MWHPSIVNGHRCAGTDALQGVFGGTYPTLPLVHRLPPKRLPFSLDRLAPIVNPDGSLPALCHRRSLLHRGG